jgi:hypothetical protein
LGCDLVTHPRVSVVVKGYDPRSSLWWRGKRRRLRAANLPRRVYASQSASRDNLCPKSAGKRRNKPVISPAATNRGSLRLPGGSSLRLTWLPVCVRWQDEERRLDHVSPKDAPDMIHARKSNPGTRLKSGEIKGSAASKMTIA